MPVRSFNIQDLLDYDPNNDDCVSSQTRSATKREKESGRKETEETDVTVIIDVENHHQDKVLLHKDENGIDRKNKKDRTHNSEG